MSELLRHPLLKWPWRGVMAMGQNNVFGLASQLAYSFLFALFPFLLCLVALASFLPIHDLVDRLLFEISPFLPRAGNQLIAENLHDVVQHRHVGLLSLAFLLALWSSSGAITGLMTGLNQVYGVVDSRPFFITRALALALTVAADVAGVVACLLIVAGGSVGRFLAEALQYPGLYSDALRYLRWPIAAASLFGTAVVLYIVLPDVRLRIRDVAWGALAAAGLWVAASLGFASFLRSFPTFGAAYGSLGAVIVLLTWLWINGLLLILGGQINALIAEARGVQYAKK